MPQSNIIETTLALDEHGRLVHFPAAALTPPVRRIDSLACYAAGWQDALQLVSIGLVFYLAFRDKK